MEKPVFWARVGQSYRIVIPKRIVNEYGLREGDHIRVEILSIARMGTIEVEELEAKVG